MRYKVACDIKSYECMYNKCEKCKTITIDFCKDKLNNNIRWLKWVRVPHKYEKSGKILTTKKMVKQQMNGSVADLLQEFNQNLPAFATHFFNWKEQQRQYRQCINNLTENEILIICDFSENYESKYSEEIQSTHYSKQSITLHTGVIFFKERSQSFVTISDNICHEPHAIWAHLLPVIKFAKENCQIKTIHFFSDGPSSQYRQKKNFLLLSLFTEKLNLKSSTWSFSESGHGKSVADGIGGAVKRKLDGLVTYGKDITSGLEAYNNLKSTLKSIKCFYVSDDDVKHFKKLLTQEIKPVPGTMQIHQVICNSEKPNTILYRPLSCFCQRNMCTCYQPKIHTFAPKKQCLKELPTISRKPAAPAPAVIQSDEDDLPITPHECIDPASGIVHSDEETLPITLQVSTGMASGIAHLDEEDLPKKSHESTGPASVILQSDEDVELPIGFLDTPIDCEEIISMDRVTLLTDYEIVENLSDLILPKDLEVVEDNGNVDVINKTSLDSSMPFTVLAENSINKRTNINNVSSKNNSIPSISSYKLKPIITASKLKGDQKRKIDIKLTENLVPQKKVKLNITTKMSHRTFTCNICLLKKGFNLTEMRACESCKKWSCVECSGKNSFDYVCLSCNYSKV